MAAVGGRGEGAQTSVPSRHPARSTGCGGGVWRGSTWSWAGRGALTLRLLCGGAWGCAEGRRRRQGAGTASPGVRGVWGPGVRLRAPAAACNSRGRAPLQSQLPLPSTCGGGAPAGAGSHRPRPSSGGKVERCIGSTTCPPAWETRPKEFCVCARGLCAILLRDPRLPGELGRPGFPDLRAGR